MKNICMRKYYYVKNDKKDKKNKKNKKNKINDMFCIEYNKKIIIKYETR